MSIFQEFKTFAMRGNAIDLAVGIVVGAAFTSIVNSLVKDIITPPLGLALGGIDFSNFFVVLKGNAVTTLKEATDSGAVTLNYGLFINAVINFIIVAFALFMVVRQLNRLTAPRPAPPAPPPPPPEDVTLLREIRDLLKDRK
jgi:large conductance mechanosensitive channel